MAPVEAFDVVIVGAGSAGCVMAERLSRDPALRVAVVEAGGSDRRVWIKLPVGYGRLFFDPKVNWKYTADPDPGLNGRSDYWPRGKVLGGSSSINALVYCRGLPQDFDDWAATGALGWGWDDVRPVYERLERRVASDGGCSGTGPVWVSDVSRRLHPVGRHFLAAAAEVGLAGTADFNGEQPEGVGVYANTTRHGRRWSAADGFLRPAMRRPNVTVFSHAVAERILFDGRRATGVAIRQGSRQFTLTARRLVVSSAGSIGSPQLLQLSGVGPGALLQRLGIPVVHDAPQVGAGLQDHLAVDYGFKVTEPTLNNALRPWWGKLRAGLVYALTRGGPLSLSVNQYGGFVRSHPDRPVPDLQLYFNPATYSTAATGRRRIVNPDPFPGVILSHQPSRPTSRGRLEIRSPDPAVPPSLQPNSLSTDSDIVTAIAGGRLLQRLAAAPPLVALLAEPLGPDLACLDDNGLLADFRARAGSVYHPVSTCAMGVDPATSVVDPHGMAVHGLENLCVVDASVFPNLTSGNTNGPTLMVAAKAGDAVAVRLGVA